MTSSLRFVLDTNVVLSAALKKESVSRQAFDQALAQGNILISAAVIEELNDVLRRERFNRYVNEEERMIFLTALVREAVFVEVLDTITDCRDPNDNKFLELAISGRADCIISGDNDLLVLHPFRAIPILTPRGFLDSVW